MNCSRDKKIYTYPPQAGGRPLPASLIYIYYHIIQMADGIHVLCSNSCFIAAVPLLRSLWEGTISIEYMLKSDFENRSTAWLALCHLDLKRYAESMDSSTPAGQKVADLKQNDKYFGNSEFFLQHQEIIKKQIEICNSVLQKPKFAKVLGIMSNGTKQEKKLNKWYSINGGPTSLKELALCVGRPLEYEFLYSSYSAISHAKDASRMLGVEGDFNYLQPIRNTSRELEVFKLTCGYLLFATRRMAIKLRPEETIREDLKEIMSRHRPEVVASLDSGIQGNSQ